MPSSDLQTTDPQQLDNWVKKFMEKAQATGTPQSRLNREEVVAEARAAGQAFHAKQGNTNQTPHADKTSSSSASRSDAQGMAA